MIAAASLQAQAVPARPTGNLTHAGRLLQRKCACGSPSSSLTDECAECQAKQGRTRLQAQLAIGGGASNNPLEAEADRVAAQVLAAPARATVGATSPHIQRIARQAAGQAAAAPASVERALAGTGRPLEPALRQDMEQRFGHDFSRVRVHSGAVSDASAREVNAHAYTAGDDIVFAAGMYAPGTHDGRRLIAHELTHVVQQSGAEAVRAGRSDGAIGRVVHSTPPGLLMRQPAERAERPADKDQTDKPAAKAEADADPCTAADPNLPVYPDAEQKQRDKILQDMLRGLTADEKKALCLRFRRALAAFSTNQMRTMNAAGVRFWRADEFPPPFHDEFAPGKKRRNEAARYQPEVRIIQWRPAAGVAEIRHELAHAWDHVRGGKVPRLDNYKAGRLRKAIQTPAVFSSQSKEKRLRVEEAVDGKRQKVDLSIKDVFDRFMKQPAPPHWSFANTKTDPEHVTSNVREFYAEGYSVFHDDNVDAQAQLLCDAPELYQVLEKEANEERLAVPDRAKLDAKNKTDNRKCVQPPGGAKG